MSELRTPEPAIARLVTLASERPELERELAESRAEFFGGAGEPGAGPDAARRRHLEWFLFERVSPALEGVPAERLMPEWLERATGPEADVVEGLLGTLSGIFEVTGRETGQGIWARDLLGGGEYPLSEPEAAGELEHGDLLVGRIFPLPDSLYRLSPVVGVFRNPDLRKALHRDMESLRASRRGSLRISQAELERMFFDAEESGSDPAEARAAAEAVLRRGGLAPERAREAVERVLARPFDPDSLVHGVGDALGEVLDELAFETEVDLDAARRSLWAAWSTAAAARGVARPLVDGSEEPVDVRSALESFDAARRAGGDLDQLFDQLERDLGIATESAGDAEGATPDFPDVVRAVLEEYRWDRERAGVPAGDVDELQSFAEYTAGLGVFENLGRRELVTYCALWVPERGVAPSQERAAKLLDALRDFCRWCEDEHELELWSSFEDDWRALREDLPRVMATRPRWTEQGPAGEILTVRGSTLVPLRGDGTERPLPRDLAESLREGDVVRLSGGGEERIQRVFPPQAGEFLAEDA